MNYLIIAVVCYIASTLGAICGIGGGPINLVALFFLFSRTTKEAV